MYVVYCDDYVLSHHEDFEYFNCFEFNGKKFPIGSYVTLTQDGERVAFRNRGYGFRRGGFRLIDHYITNNGIEEWEYIIGRSYSTNVPYIHTTTTSPDAMIQKVHAMEMGSVHDVPGKLEIEFKEPNYFPKDSEVEGVGCGWLVFIVVFLAAFLFKDWWIRVIIQIVAGFYFGSWRNNKINDAITKQDFKNKHK